MIFELKNTIFCVIYFYTVIVDLSTTFFTHYNCTFIRRVRFQQFSLNRYRLKGKKKFDCTFYRYWSSYPRVMT